MLHHKRLFVFCQVAFLSTALAWAQSAADARPGEPTDDPPSAKLQPRLLDLLATDEPVKTWVFFTDKALNTSLERQAVVKAVAAGYNARAAQRRMLRGPGARGEDVFNLRDVPVEPTYVQAVTATGARLHIQSRWLNAISVYATRPQAEQIAHLPFVERLEAVGRSRRIDPVEVDAPEAECPTTNAPVSGRLDYGASTDQLQEINLLAVHAEGYTGQGVVIGILDTGFERSHVAFNHPLKPVTVVAEYDFINNDDNTQIEPGDPGSQHEHGTLILGCIGAYRPGELVGGAYSASFILCKTEDTTGEYPAEEDNFVAGLEFIEQNGGDMFTSSLGYIDWYSQNDLDGQTAVTTIAVNIATSLGVHCCTAAGNENHDSNPYTSHLIAPSDAFQVITCGAVNNYGVIASFSSDGPTADGRPKPELVARGVGTHTVDAHSTTDYTTADGTSLSTPLVACAVACLIQAHPEWTVPELRTALCQTAEYYVAHGTYDPLHVYGYGLVNAYRPIEDCDGNSIPDLCDLDCGPSGSFCDVSGCGASPDCNSNGIPDACEEDCNGNGIPDDCDVASGTSPDCNRNAIPDECDIASGTSPDCQPNGIPDECDLYPPPDVPFHDACADAELVCTNIHYYGSTAAATNDGSASCGSSSTSPDVWYFYRPWGNGYLTISLCGSAYDTVLSLHTGCPGTAANELACNDDYCGPQSQLGNILVADGTPYWIRIAGHGGNVGNFCLTLAGPACDYHGGDCNDNDVPDECDLADCPPLTPACADCNINGVLDECDIAAGTSLDANGNGVPDECEDCTGQVLGDANCDGVLNSFDIDTFVLALNDPTAWESQFAGPDCHVLCVCDCNLDGAVNSFDIDAFVAILTGK